jgi:hypothetical protein
MDILNFISWIASKRRVVTSAPDDALLPIGIRTETRDDKYTTVAITYKNFANQTRALINFVSTGIFSTNNTTDTFLTSVLIPANTYSSTDALVINAQFTKISGNTANSYFYINTVNSLSGATLLATNNLVTGSVFSILQRNLYINAPSTYLCNTAAPSQLDSNVSGIGAILNIDWTSDQYIIAAGKVSNSAISVTCTGLRIY